MFDLVKRLEGKRIVLASKSPRRRDILARVGLKFEIVGSTFAEDLEKGDPDKYAQETAQKKALEVFDREKDADLVIGADSIVVSSDGAILEKPESMAHAKAMLLSYSDTSIKVISGVCFVGGLVDGDVTFSETTVVHFGPISEALADAYLEAAGDSVLDKAGGFGYQDDAASLIRGIEGCYYNVVGLPVFSFASHLRKLFHD